MMSIERVNRIGETLELDPHDRYALAELRALENPCVSSADVRVGMKVHYTRTHASEGIYEVTGITTLFNGSFQFKCKGFSEGGVEIHPSLTFGANEEVEVIG